MLDVFNQYKKTIKKDKFIELVKQWNLTELSLFVKGKNTKFPSNETNLNEAIQSLLANHKVNLGDNDIKIKKCLDVLITISIHKKNTISSMHKLIQLIESNVNIINQYDQEHKQIYLYNLENNINNALDRMEQLRVIEEKNSLLHRQLSF